MGSAFGYRFVMGDPSVHTDSAPIEGRRLPWQAILVATVFLVTGASGLWLSSRGSGEPDVAREISDDLQEAAMAGDPGAVGKVWWLAYWSGRPDIFVPLTHPEIVSANTLQKFVGHSEFHAALNPGASPLGVGGCERAVGFDEVRLLCDVDIFSESEGYVWEVGRRQDFSVVIDHGLVTSVSFNGYHLDGIDAMPRIVALAESANESGFAVACRGDPGGFELFDEPVEFFALQDEIVEFTDFVVKRECGEFLRAVLDGNT